MMQYLFIAVLIYGLVMGGINMLISTISDMKREKAGEENPDVQEPDAALEEESKTVVAETDAPRPTASIKGGRPYQGIDDIFRDKTKGKEGILKEFLLKIAVEDQNLVEGYADRLAKYFNSDVSQKKDRCRYLDLQISDRDAVLQQRQKQADALPSLGFPPEKGLLGYNTKEVEQYFASAVAKDRLRVASTIKVDDEPTRKQMWDVIQEYRPKVKEYDKLISDPDALERKAKEIREQQSRQRIMEVVLAALGPDFKPEYFESLPTYGGYDELVT